MITTIGATRLVGLGVDDRGIPRAIGVLKASVDALPDGARLALGVVREGRSVQFDGAVAARYLPPLRLELGEGDLVGSTTAAAGGGRASDATPTGCGRTSGPTCGHVLRILSNGLSAGPIRGCCRG